MITQEHSSKLCIVIQKQRRHNNNDRTLCTFKYYFVFIKIRPRILANPFKRDVETFCCWHLHISILLLNVENCVDDDF